MGRTSPEYKPVHVGASIVAKDAYKDYMEFSKVRDPKKFTYYTDYRRVARKIWKKIAEASMDYESGVFDKDFMYLVPQVVGNVPYVVVKGGQIRTNDHTNGDIYSPIYCNLNPNYKGVCWSVDGTYVVTYTTRLKEIIDRLVPTYYFNLPTIIKNKLW